MKKKILLAFDDPGGGLAVSSLIESISNEIYGSLIIYIGKLSRRFLYDMNPRNSEIKEIQSFIERKEAEEILENEKPDILVTGTGGGNAEQELRNAAYRKNIKSIVILDYWKDYGRRWKYSDYSFDEMKDIICVMDEETKNEMNAENFKSENIIVTGHPYLDKLFNHNNKRDLKSGPDIRDNFILKNILFLSQPLEIIGVKEYKIHPLEIFLNAVDQLAVQKNEKLFVKVKLHPSERKSEEIIEISKKFNSDLTEVEIVSEENSLKDLIDNCDIAAGYNTIALFEVRAAGKRSVSLKVAEINYSLNQAMSYAGIEFSEPDTESIFECLNKDNAGTIHPEKFSGGIENCVKLIKKELSLN